MSSRDTGDICWPHLEKASESVGILGKRIENLRESEQKSLEIENLHDIKLKYILLKLRDLRK